MNIKSALLVFLLSLCGMNAQPVLPTLPPGRMLNYWRFDDTNWLSLFGTGPRSVVNVELTDGVDLNAARFAGLFAAQLPYNVVESNGRTNLALQNGSVRFWFRPDFDSGTGPGTYARLLDVGAYTTDGSYGWWSLYLDPAGTNLFFSAQANGQGSNFLAASVQWSAWEWHQIALTYSPSNSTLYVDGSAVAEGTGVTFTPSGSVQLATGFALGSDATGGNLAQGSFDELKTYNYPVSAAQMERFYADESTLYGVGSFLFMMNNSISPPGLGEGGGTNNFVSVTNVPAYFGLSGSTNLWIEILPPTNSVSVLILHNTKAGTNYQILVRGELSIGSWSVFQDLVGATGTNRTVTTALTALLPMQFFVVRVSEDRDDDGLSDAYELLVTGTDPDKPDTGNTGVLDGYKDPDGDGWTNLEEMQNGTNPLVFNTPDAPHNFVVSPIAGSSNAVVSWDAAHGNVTGYRISIFAPEGWQTYTVGVSTLAVTLPYHYPGATPDATPFYLQALYAGGESETSPTTRAGRKESAMTPFLLRGTEGKAVLGVAGLNERMTHVEVTWSHDYLTWSTVSIVRSNFTNGLFPIPDNLFPVDLESSPFARVIMDDGESGTPQELASALMPNESHFYDYTHTPGSWRFLPFVDTRAQIRDNLIFQLRTAAEATSYQSLRSAYVYSAFHTHDPFYGDVDFNTQFDPMYPLALNYALRNQVFSTNAFSTSGLFSPNYSFNMDSATNGGTLSSLIGTNATQFVLSPEDELDWIADTNGELVVTLTNAYYNYVGLACLADVIVWHKNSAPHNLLFDVIQPGQSATRPGYTWYYSFRQIELPVFQSTGYYFAQVDPNRGAGYLAPVPGEPNFSLTNTSPPFFVAQVGQPIALSVWAKKRLLNGDTTTVVFAEQFFDKAFKADANGSATTNETGLLTEYGEFFPSEPGRVILTTKPDLDTGETSQCLVYAIRIDLDVDHDGTMNRNWDGPDVTSENRPFRFWINDDADNATEDQQRTGVTNSADNIINGPRDLEDFARLWISGMPSLPTGYVARLSWSGEGAIKLYHPFEGDGGIGYLTNESIANRQTDISGSAPGTSFATVSSSGSYQFSANTFSNALDRHFLFEGFQRGKGQLVLTIERGTNVAGQATAFMALDHVRNMYERASISNAIQTWPEMVQQTNISGFRLDYQPDYGPDADEVAVFVHGWRMTQWDYDSFSATMFKRLYWQGFKGRFASFRWPTRSKQTELFSGMSYITYNRSEQIAFNSGTGLAAYLDGLRSRFPSNTISACAHSMGGIIMMQALKKLANMGHRPLDNLVFMQAAVPANCFDTNVANFAPFMNQEQITPTPDIYRNYAAGITNALRNGGRIANFFNPADFALWSWQFNQALYVTNFLIYGPVSMKPNTFLGYYTDGTNSFLRTNALNQSVFSILYDGYYLNGPTRTVTNVLELMPFVARPRSLAVGAQPSVHGQIQGQELNLQDELGFDADESDHSGQFNRNIQDTAIWPFYFQLRTNLFPSQ